MPFRKEIISFVSPIRGVVYEDNEVAGDGKQLVLKISEGNCADIDIGPLKYCITKLSKKTQFGTRVRFPLKHRYHIFVPFLSIYHFWGYHI